MEFSELEKNVRAFITQNKITEAITFLIEHLNDDEGLDELTLQLASYNAISDKNRIGTATDDDVERAFNILKSNILKLLKAKKEYFKYKELTFGQTIAPPKDNNDTITVFFSLASPHNDTQQQYINELSAYFLANGIKLETLKGWDDNDPLIPITKEMKNSSGCLVLALERMFVQKGVNKRGSGQAGEIKDKAYTSSWLQIEAALARSFELPIIILKEESLENEGLIHNDKQEWGIVRINPDNIAEIQAYPIKNFILNWINEVKRYDKEKNKR